MWTAIALTLSYGAIFALYGAWAASRVDAGAAAWPFVLALPLVYLAVPLAFVLIWFGIAYRFRAECPADLRLSWRERVRLFAEEFVTVAGSAPRMIAYRWLVPDPPPAPADVPILLVHGVLCNAGVWNALVRWLRERGVGPVYTVSYGPPLASIDAFAGQVARKIDDILDATGGRKVVLVGHSMGGLVIRAYLRGYGGAKVARVVTIGTPHEGSVHAWMAAGACLAQMRPGNAWLAALGAPQGETLPPIVSLWSWHDSMVAPQTSSRIPFGENVELSGVAHNALLRNPAVFERVLEQIRIARADAPGR
ncbi:MAG TPA: alpha/beta fold hydrolase [Casimicrobiaceae bacterium]|nr:alpha/beta fold hydrolase [Casimicrobiaceae bacterium]